MEKLIVFRIDIKKELEKKGWTQIKIRENKLLGQKTYYDMVNDNKVPGIKGLEALCFMLDKQPGSIIKYIPNENKTE